ncbi:MAG: hypothetical protein QOJ01_1890, partial [Solirubrobacterales bacterium]|nr:hypothetical protein [Solirubrobacterales bacterium]
MSDATRAPGPGDADPGELRPGRQFAGHVIEAEIGRGGMGVVYRARNVALERERALKVIAPALSADPGFRERFRRESRLAAQVEHPNVVPVHDAGEEEGRLYIAMRLVDGEDLRATVEREGALQPARVAALIAGVAEGLDAAHDRGLVHRDVKPSNILIESGRAGERAFLTDFGISRSVGSDSSLTSAKVFLGSVDYVAPEQVEGEAVDSRADVYALGGVAYFALTGQPPYRRDTDLAKLFAHANAVPPRPSDAAAELPAAVDDVIARAMAKKPGERYAAARDFASDLRAAVGGEPIAPAPKPVPAERSEATTSRIGLLRRHMGIAAAAGALVLAGAAA